jgi:hypothetical protein
VIEPVGERRGIGALAIKAEPRRRFLERVPATRVSVLAFDGLSHRITELIRERLEARSELWCLAVRAKVVTLSKGDQRSERKDEAY